MKFRDFRKQFRDVGIITNQMITCMFDNEQFIQRQISERTKKKWLIQLKKGYYLIAEDKEHISQFTISNQLIQPSYISNETALSYWWMIPEGVFTTTAITTKNTKTISNSVGEFSYNHIKPHCFTGFIEQDTILIATPEKALVDFLYFKSQYIKNPTDTVEQFRLQNLTELDFIAIDRYARLFNKKKLHRILLYLKHHHDWFTPL